MKKRVLAISISIAMLMVCMLPMTALAGGVVTIDLSTTLATVPGAYTVSGNEVTLEGGDYILTGTTTAYNIIAAANANITFNNVSIDATAASQSAFYINNGVTVNMTLTGISTLTSGGGYAAIDATTGRTLIITAASTGSLTVTGGDGNGEVGGSGIGGGSYSEGGTITIAGGAVTANGGINGAGIGGGSDGNGGTITISGGTVTAYGGRTGNGNGGGGAGIGGGDSSNGGNITISGGTVTANGVTEGHNSHASAGIGGGDEGDGGNITITGGTVAANGGEGGAGIGGGGYGDGGTVIISGGNVFASGKNSYDIGFGKNSSGGGTLGISGTAAVFLRNDECITPTTTTHTHETITAVTDGKVYGITVAGWEPNFGAYLRFPTLTYDTNNGSGTAPGSVTQLAGTTVTVSDGSGLSKTNYTFSDWNTAADGNGTAYAAGSTFSFPEDTTLYAQWMAQPELSSSVTSGTIYVGGRITLTPNIDGGAWDWDEDFFTATFNSPATFTGLKAGTSTITYTVEGVSVTYDVTIEQSQLPFTGQNYTLVYLLAAFALVAGGAAAMYSQKQRRRERAE